MARKAEPQTIDVLSARVDRELYKQVCHLSKTKDLTVSQMVRAAMREYVARQKEPANAA